MVPANRLQTLPFFTGLPADALARLSGKITELSLKDGAPVFKEGDPGDAVFFIEKGQVVIRKVLDKKAKTFKVIATLAAGDLFGEMSLLLDSAHRSADALCEGPATVFRLASADFSKIMESDSKAAALFFSKLITTISGRLRETTREMVAIFEVGRIMAEDLEPKALAARIFDGLIRSFEEVVAGAFFFWNEFSQEFEPVATDEDWPRNLKEGRTPADGLFRQLTDKAVCLLSDDFAADERFSPETRKNWSGLRSLLATPVMGPKGPIGFIVFAHLTATGKFQPGNRQVMAGVANLVAPAFENAAHRQERLSQERLMRARLGYR